MKIPTDGTWLDAHLLIMWLLLLPTALLGTRCVLACLQRDVGPSSQKRTELVKYLPCLSFSPASFCSRQLGSASRAYLAGAKRRATYEPSDDRLTSSSAHKMPLLGCHCGSEKGRGGHLGDDDCCSRILFVSACSLARVGVSLLRWSQLILYVVPVTHCFKRIVFSRFAWRVTPRNYLLLACHLTNATAQITQGARFVVSISRATLRGQRARLSFHLVIRCQAAIKR